MSKPKQEPKSQHEKVLESLVKLNDLTSELREELGKPSGDQELFNPGLTENEMFSIIKKAAKEAEESLKKEDMRKKD